MSRSDVLSAKRRWPRVSLLTILLGLTLAGVVMAWHRDRTRRSRSEATLESMQKLSRRLVVDDPTKIAVCSGWTDSSNSDLLRFYLPPMTPTLAKAQSESSQPYRLCWAFDEIPAFPHDVTNDAMETFPNPEGQTRLDAGRHELLLRIEAEQRSNRPKTTRIRFRLNGEIVADAVQPPEWRHNGAFQTSIGVSTHEPDRRTVIYHRRPAPLSLPPADQRVWNQSPKNGVIVWIEPAMPDM